MLCNYYNRYVWDNFRDLFPSSGEIMKTFLTSLVSPKEKRRRGHSKFTKLFNVSSPGGTDPHQSYREKSRRVRQRAAGIIL